MKEQIIEISNRISKYSDKELEEQLIEINRLIEKGFNDMIHITEFNMVVIEIIKRQSTKD